MPRRYRGMDIFWWLETHRPARPHDRRGADADAARREPSLQLVGRAAADGVQDLDLAALQASASGSPAGCSGIDGHGACFGDDLRHTIRDADAGWSGSWTRSTGTSTRVGSTGEVLAADAAAPGPVAPAPAGWTCGPSGIGTVVWSRPATARNYRGCGCRSSTPDGSIRADRGVTACPGLYVVGQRFQHRRDSGFIDGARHDAAAVVRTPAP